MASSSHRKDERERERGAELFEKRKTLCDCNAYFSVMQKYDLHLFQFDFSICSNNLIFCIIDKRIVRFEYRY